LFLLLTGRVPFHADSAVVVGIMHVSEEIPRLPAYLQIFQPIIDCVLAKEPLKRYQTGAELIEDLEAISAIDVADAAAEREQYHRSTNDAPSMVVEDPSASLSYSQAAFLYHDNEKSSTMLTTKIPAFTLPDDDTNVDNVGDASAGRERSVPRGRKD